MRLAVDRHHPAFGKAVLCEACDGPPVVIGDVLGRIGVPMRYRAECIEDWRPADGRERQAVERYVATWPPSKPFLALVGARGLGKTMLGVGILRACRERHNATGLFRVVPDLLDDYRRTQDPERATESMDDLDDRLTRVPVLVLDDLGVGRQTEFGWERLYVVINRRYNDGRATVITTNVDLLGIEDRVRSRMLSGEVVMFSGRDQRLAS